VVGVRGLEMLKRHFELVPETDVASDGRREGVATEQGWICECVIEGVSGQQIVAYQGWSVHRPQLAWLRPLSIVDAG